MLKNGFQTYGKQIVQNQNLYKYNGKEIQTDFDLDWYDYGARFYDVQLGRWHVIDNKAEKYFYVTLYNYVDNNPLLFVDPDGNDKFKAQAHFKLTTGFNGAGVKALGVKWSLGGVEKEISINISFDTDSKLLSIGGTSVTRETGSEELTMGSYYGGGETTEKENGTEAFAGFNFNSMEFEAGTEEIKDDDFKEVGEATIAILHGKTKEGEGNEIGIGANPEVNLGIIGVGTGFNFSVQTNPYENSNSNNSSENKSIENSSNNSSNSNNLSINKPDEEKL